MGTSDKSGTDKPSTLRSVRFTLERELGSGGFGVVYRALDNERGEQVALKLLHKLDAGALYRFKQEFRSLADIVHPNLVTLHELFCEQGQWYFTMELVRGEDFLRHVGMGAVDDEATLVDGATADLGEAGVGERVLPVVVGGGKANETVDLPTDLDLARLRAALPQLVEGIRALHTAGKLHRDIKPANVLVDGQGCVKLLDFGLVTELSGEETESRLTGTPYYMSPEQAAGGERLTEGTDWYSVGVMLYQVLTGTLPHKGSFMEVLMHKQQLDPPAPDQVNPAAPADLTALCMQLMRRDPAERPAGEAISELFGEPLHRRPSPLPRVSRSAGSPAPLVGRDRGVEALADAFKQTKRGRTVLLHLHGPSGVGKSTLVQRFIDDLQLREWFVTLSGRCYQQESVPYKALDSLVDALCNHLRDLPLEEADAILPRNVAALARLFPVLGRVDAVTGAMRRAPARDVAPQEQRRRAFSALRELLGRLGERTPLVLYLDDVQWGDGDSGELLEQLLRPPDPPPLLLLACYRSEALKTSPFVRRLRGLATDSAQMTVLEVPVEELDPEAAQELARSLGLEALASAVAEESKGNPFFIATLVDYLRETRATDTSSVLDVSLEQALRSRLEALPDVAALVLELICLAGLPISERALSHACGTDALDQGHLRLLRTGNLVRSHAADERDLLEPYHDRVRETIVGFLEEERRREQHRRLARALDAVGEGDPEALAVHLEGAGDPIGAAEHARKAAEQATQALAFDRAAALYRKALELDHEADTEARRAMRVKLADSLAYARRGPDAAAVYLEAATGSAQIEGLELKRRAAEQLLKTGYVDRGRALLTEVLEASGMKMPKTTRRALLALIWRRIQLRLRGLKHSARDAEQIPPELAARIDLCWTGWTGLGMHDFIHASEFHAQNLLLSLKVGDPYRIARALVMESTFRATEGISYEGFDALLQEARRLADQADSRHARALVELGYGVGAYMLGRFGEIHAPCVRAEQLLRGLPACSWEMSMAHLYAIEGLIHTGRLGDLQEVLRRYIDEADARGDLFGGLSMRVQGHVAHLAADEPDLALEMVRQGMDAYTHQEVRLPHYWEFYAVGQIRLYRGEGVSALAWAREWMPRLRRAQILRVKVARLAARYLLGRAAIVAAMTPYEPVARHLRVAHREARRLRRDGWAPSTALALLLDAGVAALEGDRNEAGLLLQRAEEILKELNLNLYAAVARRRQGQIFGGDQGAELVAQVDAWLAEQKILNPVQMSAMLIPGFAE